jgi:hypothetical protein
MSGPSCLDWIKPRQDGYLVDKFENAGQGGECENHIGARNALL